jgi:hypothetical protein
MEERNDLIKSVRRNETQLVFSMSFLLEELRENRIIVMLATIQPELLTFSLLSQNVKIRI